MEKYSEQDTMGTLFVLEGVFGIALKQNRKKSSNSMLCYWKPVR